MKSKIIKAEPLEELSYAYMKELRSHNRTKKVYEDINPYAEVYQFRENIYGIYTENADGGGAPWSYLVIGPERAMLIDTGFGIGDLKGLTDVLTGGMPLFVVNTHTHRDHVYGNCQFPEVFCHTYAVPGIEKTMRMDAWDMLFDRNGCNIWLEFSKKDIIPFREYRINGCENHYIFSLGGDYEIELFYLGGHDLGQAGFLDKKSRIFFSGDAFLSMYMIINGPKGKMPHGENATVNCFAEQLEALTGRMNEFDSIFPGHFVTDIQNSVIPNVLSACRKIIRDPYSFDFEEKRKEKMTRFKLVRGLGAIAYSENSFL